MLPSHAPSVLLKSGDLRIPPDAAVTQHPHTPCEGHPELSLGMGWKKGAEQFWRWGMCCGLLWLRLYFTLYFSLAVLHSPLHLPLTGNNFPCYELLLFYTPPRGYQSSDYLCLKSCFMSLISLPEDDVHADSLASADVLNTKENVSKQDPQ